VHGNAFNTSAKGYEVFTSKGLTRSDAIAEVFAIETDNMFPSQSMRWDLTDGDKDKEANFYVLKNTDMPAILTENFFFDNPKEAKIMMSDEGQDKIAQAHVNAIVAIEKGNY
jgi:N-acetylmuramoyl-L-alanine amidase